MVSAVRDLSRVRTHATQLAGHLQAARDELAHREAEVNTRIAVTENDMRAARLWLQERSHELDERKSDLDQREERLQQAEARLAEALGTEQNWIGKVILSSKRSRTCKTSEPSRRLS